MAICRAAEDIKREPKACNRVFDVLEAFKRFGQESECIFGDLIEVRFTIDFNIWKFPQVRIDNASGSLLNEEAGISLDHKCEKLSRRGRTASGKVWEQMDDAFAMGDAVGFEGAFGATRIFRRANERPEFH